MQSANCVISLGYCAMRSLPNTFTIQPQLESNLRTFDLEFTDVFNLPYALFYQTYCYYVHSSILLHHHRSSSLIVNERAASFIQFYTLNARVMVSNLAVFVFLTFLRRTSLCLWLACVHKVPEL